MADQYTKAKVQLFQDLKYKDQCLELISLTELLAYWAVPLANAYEVRSNKDKVWEWKMPLPKEYRPSSPDKDPQWYMICQLQWNREKTGLNFTVRPYWMMKHRGHFTYRQSLIIPSQVARMQKFPVNSLTQGHVRGIGLPFELSKLININKQTPCQNSYMTIWQPYK